MIKITLNLFKEITNWVKFCNLAFMRGLNWKRSQQERVLRKRIKKFHEHWYHFHTENGDKIHDPIWVDFIGLKGFYTFLKNSKTTKWETRHKVKYSPNKNKGYYRDKKPNKNQLSSGTREKDNMAFRKMWKEWKENDYYEPD